MPRLFLITACYLVTCAVGWSDGYPFDPETQRLTVPSLRIKLADKQVQEISATGTITFEEQNMRLIRLHYPAAGNRANVIAATFNDNHESLGPEDVYCIWVAPDEIAVTLNDQHPKEKSPFGELIDPLAPLDAQLREMPYRRIRISPDGIIYFRGIAITFEQVSAMITEIASISQPPEKQTGSPPRLEIVMPPPLSTTEISRQSTDSPRTPQQIYDSLTSQGSKSVSVQRGW